MRESTECNICAYISPKLAATNHMHDCYVLRLPESNRLRCQIEFFYCRYGGKTLQLSLVFSVLRTPIFPFLYSGQEPTVKRGANRFPLHARRICSSGSAARGFVGTGTGRDTALSYNCARGEAVVRLAGDGSRADGAIQFA